MQSGLYSTPHRTVIILRLHTRSGNFVSVVNSISSGSVHEYGSLAVDSIADSDSTSSRIRALLDSLEIHKRAHHTITVYDTFVV